MFLSYFKYSQLGFPFFTDRNVSFMNSKSLAANTRCNDPLRTFSSRLFDGGSERSFCRVICSLDPVADPDPETPADGEGNGEDAETDEVAEAWPYLLTNSKSRSILEKYSSTSLAVAILQSGITENRSRFGFVPSSMPPYGIAPDNTLSNTIQQ